MNASNEEEKRQNFLIRKGGEKVVKACKSSRIIEK
jgi:hypothetical protein